MTNEQENDICEGKCKDIIPEGFSIEFLAMWLWKHGPRISHKDGGSSILGYPDWLSELARIYDETVEEYVSDDKR